MRHARHGRQIRKPGRLELLARNRKRRAKAPEQAPEPQPAPRPQMPTGVPYDPVSVPVRKLADSLTGRTAAEVEALKAADPRDSADRYYDARLKELSDA